jgi:hypothetical protein
MRRNMILLVKLEQPHGSMEMGEKALRQQWQRRRLWGVFNLSLSFSIPYLPRQMGNASTRKAKGKGVQGKGKTTRLKKGEDGVIRDSNHLH